MTTPAPTVNIAWNSDEIRVALDLLDIATKAAGLTVAQNTLALAAKLREGHQVLTGTAALKNGEADDTKGKSRGAARN